MHLSYGELLGQVAKVTGAAPFLADPIVIEAEPGDAPAPTADADADVLAWAHNETLDRGDGAGRVPSGVGDALVLVDATSAAGGLAVDVAQADAYYFAPAEGDRCDGGLGWR